MTDIKAWLKKYMIAAEAYDADELLDTFVEEMKAGLGDNNKSSLAMIPAYVGISNKKVPVSKSVAVIDAGGTNLRICEAFFDEAGRIEKKHVGTDELKMPGKDKGREATAAEFYEILVDALEPIQDEFDTIGFCFSYPIEIKPDFDGILLRWTKEIKIPDMVGEHVGSGLIDALEQRGISGKRVVILNDTVACLLSGVTEGQTFNASSYIGFILGTGTNTAYVEKNENIGKLDVEQGSQVINVESGGFEVFKRGKYDRELDDESENKGGHLFEKAISGEYLGKLTLKLLHALAEKEDVFSAKCKASLSKVTSLSNIHISSMAANNGKETGELGTLDVTDCDLEKIKTVYEVVVDRAALLTAVNICAAVIKSGEGKDADRPVCLNIDGSTYYLTHKMQEKVKAYLQEMLDKRGLHVRYISVDDAPIVGAAIAGLTMS